MVCVNGLAFERTGWSGVQIPRGARNFSLLENVQIGAVANQTYATGTGGSVRIVNMTTHLHLVPRLIMSGAIPLLPLYAFHGVDKENINLLRL
jgi:hypothetical protein